MKLLGVVLILALAFVVAGPSPAASQQEQYPISMNPRVIATQLRDSITIGEQALRRLERPDAAENVPATLVVMNRMYKTIRAALAGMQEARGAAKFKDPFMDLQIKQVNHAWAIVRGAIDAHSNGGRTEEQYVALATEHIQAALPILRQVTELMP
jgi:hypothetical protein